MMLTLEAAACFVEAGHLQTLCTWLDVVFLMQEYNVILLVPSILFHREEIHHLPLLPH